MVGPHANLSENLTLTTSNAAMDIDLTGISKNNNGTVEFFKTCLDKLKVNLSDTVNNVPKLSSQLGCFNKKSE